MLPVIFENVIAFTSMKEVCCSNVEHSVLKIILPIKPCIINI